MEFLGRAEIILQLVEHVGRIVNRAIGYAIINTSKFLPTFTYTIGEITIGFRLQKALEQALYFTPFLWIFGTYNDPLTERKHKRRRSTANLELIIFAKKFVMLSVDKNR